MIQRVLSILLGLCLLSGIGFAKEFIYPSTGAPVFSITFPDNWDVETEGELLHSGPPDGAIYLGLWALKDVQDLTTALDSLDTAISQLVSSPKWNEPEEIEINDIPFVTISGDGTVEGGQKVNVEVAVFTPDGEQVFVLIFFGVPEAEEKYDYDLMEILQSINSAGGDPEGDEGGE